MNFVAAKEVLPWYLKSKYASPSTLERAYDYIIAHRSAVGLEAIALSPNINLRIFQNLIERFRNYPELEIAPNGARFVSDYHWAFRRLFAYPLNCYSEQSEIEAEFHSLQEFKWSMLPLNRVEANLYTAQNPRLSRSDWLELFGIYFHKYINRRCTVKFNLKWLNPHLLEYQWTNSKSKSTKRYIRKFSISILFA